jgi:uncharacterized protein YndB with AHSA1/START domain
MASIRLSKVYGAPVSLVWEYLTSDARLGSWCMPSENFSLEKGRKFKFKGEASKFWDGKFDNTVADFESPSMLSYRCESKSLGLDTVVTWRLEQRGEGETRLSLEHSGFRALRDLATRFALASGWRKMLNEHLARELASGAAGGREA